MRYVVRSTQGYSESFPNFLLYVRVCTCHTVLAVESILRLQHKLSWYGASLGEPLCHTFNLSLRLSSRTCLHMTSDDDQKRPHKKHKQHDKQHHHGIGAARPSSGVDFMNPCRLRGGQPCACSFLGRR